MTSREKKKAIILSQEEISEGIFSMWLKSEISLTARAGQFAAVYTGDASKLLPRPISVCETDKKARAFRVVYKVTGKGTGTEIFSRLKAGDEIEAAGPFGNGFPIEAAVGKKAVIAGGGIGIPPLLELAKNIKGEKEIYLGYQNSRTFLADEFMTIAGTRVATDDGSVGFKGNVVDLMTRDAAEGLRAPVGNQLREADMRAAENENPSEGESAAGNEVSAKVRPALYGDEMAPEDETGAPGAGSEVIFACGPIKMLRSVAGYAAKRGVKCYVSVEEKMACGIGACLGCVCDAADTDPRLNVKKKRVCKDGPVFLSTEVLL